MKSQICFNQVNDSFRILNQVLLLWREATSTAVDFCLSFISVEHIIKCWPIFDKGKDNLGATRDPLTSLILVMTAIP